MKPEVELHCVQFRFGIGAFNPIGVVKSLVFIYNSAQTSRRAHLKKLLDAVKMDRQTVKVSDLQYPNVFYV